MPRSWSVWLKYAVLVGVCLLLARETQSSQPLSFSEVDFVLGPETRWAPPGKTLRIVFAKKKRTPKASGQFFWSGPTNGPNNGGIWVTVDPETGNVYGSEIFREGGQQFYGYYQIGRLESAQPLRITFSAGSYLTYTPQSFEMVDIVMIHLPSRSMLAFKVPYHRANLAAPLTPSGKLRTRQVEKENHTEQEDVEDDDEE